jgi:regulator of protease activity HflC (stomatin/prohibitin superfamily)
MASKGNDRKSRSDRDSRPSARERLIVEERDAFRVNGFGALLGVVGALGVGLWLFLAAIIEAEQNKASPAATLWVGLGLFVLVALACAGFYTVQPNEARVLVFLGSYSGSVRDSGFWWSNPLAEKKRISLRVRNFNSEKLKVNDAQGNPIEIAAVVVWRVVDSARAVFDVERYEHFVSIQSETAIRALASRYPYDSHDDAQASLRGSPEDVAAELQRQLDERLDVAGVKVLDARISHLAYSPEIAQAMLRRQQANAVIAARQQIVEGAVGMVEMALKRLSEKKVVELDEERKAAMVSNLMVVLVSETETHPVVNAGSLY